jgi:hypothetical protein
VVTVDKGDHWEVGQTRHYTPERAKPDEFIVSGVEAC